MRYVRAKIDEDFEKMAYRCYVTDALQLAPQNKYTAKRWIDVVSKKPVDDRTPEEIAFDVIKNAGLVMQ
jgi:hypothetical protein